MYGQVAQVCIEGLGLLVKSKEFLIRGIPENIEEDISTGNTLVQQGTNLLDPATNFILDQKKLKISTPCYKAEKPILSRIGF